MKFLDEARVTVAGGDGGDGCVAFLREKYRPKGGPAGGDGGRGGDVIAVGDPGINTLLAFHYQQRHAAGRGENGSGKNRHGHAGADVVLRVPVGTIITDVATEEVVADVTSADERIVLAKGGRGGRGNARFATPTHQAPRRADPGEPGEVRELRLELRLLADAGLVGLPNAGKSSLLARVTAARPKIADYPFTTLEPLIGVVAVGIDRSFVLADVPGLIEGAHEGRGLGLGFLKHLSRTVVLVHLVDTSGKSPEDALRDFDTVNAELVAYSDELASKPQVVVLSKIDLPEITDRLELLRSLFGERNIQVHAVSARTGEGCRELMDHVHGRLAQLAGESGDEPRGES